MVVTIFCASFIYLVCHFKNKHKIRTDLWLQYARAQGLNTIPKNKSKVLGLSFSFLENLWKFRRLIKKKSPYKPGVIGIQSPACFWWLGLNTSSYNSYLMLLFHVSLSCRGLLYHLYQRWERSSKPLHWIKTAFSLMDVSTLCKQTHTWSACTGQIGTTAFKKKKRNRNNKKTELTQMHGQGTLLENPKHWGVHVYRRYMEYSTQRNLQIHRW